MSMKHWMTSTMLVSALFASSVEFGYATTKDSTPAAKASQKVATGAAITDPSIAGQRFLEHVNYARVAIALNDVPAAKEHIVSARSLVAVLKAPTTERTEKVTTFPSGRINYQYETRHSDHYFPIQAGPVTAKKLKRGPIWADEKGVAVTDAEIVYLSLDLDGNDAEKSLDEAYQDLEKNDLKAAQDELADLVDDVVEIDDSVEVPLDKARDNIALTRQFIAAKNYDGARFALKHADKALDEMEDDTRYTQRRTMVGNMRAEVSSLEEQIARRDPTALNKIDRTLEKWWNELKS